MARQSVVANGTPRAYTRRPLRVRPCILDDAMDHHLDDAQVHYEWNNALPPRLEIEPGDTVVIDCRDAADRYYRRTSTHDDVIARGPFRGHALTGPIRVKGARPGDVLVVELLEVKPADFGWTSIRPGRGLLPEADFPKPYLQIWDLSDGRFARAGDRIAVPIDPFRGDGDGGSTCPAATARCRPARTAATWTSSSSPPAPPCTSRCGWTARCSASATPTRSRATGRSASPRWR
jgi:hypothetical protein